MARHKPFNNPFGGVKLKPKQAEPSRAPAASPAKAAPGKKPPPGDADEAALFLQAVGEVAPVRRGPKVSAPPPPDLDPRRLPDEAGEVVAHLAELVAGEATFDLVDSDEYVEGALGSLDPRVLQRLRGGEYARQAHLDLHRMDRDQARAAVERFVADARHRRLRCVLIVHGRGLHSKDNLPVLKHSLQTWLTRGRLARHVLAFTSARPHDGGAGAVYVLLRA